MSAHYRRKMKRRAQAFSQGSKAFKNLMSKLGRHRPDTLEQNALDEIKPDFDEGATS